MICYVISHNGGRISIMSLISHEQVQELRKKMSNEISYLGKMYKSKKDSFYKKSVDHSLAEELLREGWEVDSLLKTKTILRKEKTHSKKFEDDLWCQMYELGYRNLNIDEKFELPFSSNHLDKKQIDVVAVNDDSILLIECKSSVKRSNAPSYKDEFEALASRMEGFIRVSKEIFGNDKKVKFIFATRNIRIKNDSEDLKRLENCNAFYYNDNTYDYINNLIFKYKKASYYQFQGLIFKNEIINSNKIELPALKGSMGGKAYYMFSIEPSTLLKLGFVLHRTRANETEFPTYQRLLVPSRLYGITKFIDDGGYFPNSIIVNFNTGKHKLLFDEKAKTGDSNAKLGVLRIPNAYGVAYIIDGQHRVYGYANSHYSENNTIPVVAFENLESSEQLEIFMDINQNQKAVSPSLRLDLEEDLYWDSDKADRRMKALKSSIVKRLSNEPSSPLFKMISVGEDPSDLTFKPFYSALSASGLLPTASGNKFRAETTEYSLYNVGNLNHSQEMNRAKKEISNLISGAYDLVARDYPDIFNEEKSLILSNRGTFPFVAVLGSINKHATIKGEVNKDTILEERLKIISKYLIVLLDKLKTITDDEKKNLLLRLGAGVDTYWLRYFESLIHETISDFNPQELVDWNERQDEDLQVKGRKIVVDLEKRIKEKVITILKQLYGNNWHLEISTIKKECMKRAIEENERNYKEGLGGNEVEWTDMFTINNYKSIIQDNWKKTDSKDGSFQDFESIFSVDIGQGFNTKSEKLKWISYLNSYRNQIAHEGTKGKGLNREEVEFLQLISDKLNI
jgi:DNA sulfur modification protein DndB